ncbi:MAG TPA: M48 family metalloprotease [Candidatus Binatia bacterium]|nr:M48 family metalloprotease [Candidatus Binatia bacterium]
MPQPAGDAPARNSARMDQYVDSAIRQERRLIELMRNFRPVIETYIQKEKPDPDAVSAPDADEYFLGRLDLTGKSPYVNTFSSAETFQKKAKKKVSKKVAKSRLLEPIDFARAVFPDMGHFDRQNYTFEFAHFEPLGEVRCAAFDVKPREDRGGAFIGRIWIEDRDFSIVRFTGTYISRRAFHFDSWRLNTLGVRWMPAYIYTQESNSSDPADHSLWFKAQTRIWGYDVRNAGDQREFAKRLTDAATAADPKRHEASQDLNPAYSVGDNSYRPEDAVVERLQVTGLMASDGEVDQILETVVNNLQVTNELDVAAVHCRVLLTTPLESFVVGRTIIVSRGLLDILPDEATLAAVLAHELAHIVLKHSLENSAVLSDRFSDLEIFSHFKFRFDAAQEAEADKKGLELLAKSPYQGQQGKVELFAKELQARSPQLPHLMRATFGNDFLGSHFITMQVANASEPLQANRLDQVAALPLGSRITVDPWSDRITMLKAKPVRLDSPKEKIPLEVTPFFPYLKRMDQQEKKATTSQ